MAKLKMNWDIVRGVEVVVYSLFLSPGVYRVKIMIGKNSTPVDKPWKAGVCKPCKSHLDAFHAAERFVIAAVEKGELKPKEKTEAPTFKAGNKF